MATANDDAPQHDAESEVWSAIAAFEAILEAMPDDRASLETLSHAYEHIGDQAKTLEYLLRLGDVIVRDGDAEAASHIAGKLRAFGSSDEQLAAVCERLDRLSAAADAPTADEKTPAGRSVRASSQAFRVADELSFAWRLFEAGELTQEEYASVAQDLSEMSADDHLSTASVLHTLDARAFSGMERLMGYVTRDAQTPIISLLSFDIQEEAYGLLPIEFIVRRGAMVFALMGDDALVAVMNPYDETLREQVQAKVGRPCHFFISLPSEFDAVIGKVVEAAAEA
jgi:hypothetical protein